MAMKTTEYIILVLLLCYVQGNTTTTNVESCFVETKVETKVHCRFGGNECNTVSLKRDFPHLFNQSYNSDDPELVTVTPFCETRVGDSTSRPGLEFQFSPPGHRGVTEIRGFEVRLEGGPPSMSDFKCTIFELDDKLTLENSRVTFASRFYPVTRRMPYVVVFSSLPRKDDSYLNEIHVKSKSCDTQETSADWKPSYCNVSYNSDSEILNVNFEPPPEKFHFDQFDVYIVTFEAGFEQTHHRINQTEFSVPNIKPGEYEIRIRPYNPDRNNDKLCKCRNIDGRCETCSELFQRFTAEVTEVQKTSILTENNLNVSTVIIPVLCVLACVAATCVIICLRKRGVKFHLHTAIVDANPETKPSIVIIFDDNSRSQRRIADKLRTLFSSVFGENIHLEVKTVCEHPNKEKVDMQIHLSEPGVTIAEIIQMVNMLQVNVEKLQNSREKHHENLQVRQAFIVFDAIQDKEMVPKEVTCFHMMSGLPKLINQLNSSVQLSHDDIKERMQTLDFKLAYDELDDLINKLKRVHHNRETKLFVDLPASRGGDSEDILDQNRCLSNNSEPDSGIRSGDEFGSLNSSEERMNDNIQNYKRNQDWIQSMNSQDFMPNSEYQYTGMPYEDEQVQNLNWKSTESAAGCKVLSKSPRCPSEIQFIAPDPTEYSEYGEDVFFDEANHLAALHYPVHNSFHYTYNHAPSSVPYQKVHSNCKIQNNRECASRTKPHKGRHRQEVKNCKEEHSSMESLMDKMADVNARYQHSLGHECLHEEHDQMNGKLLCPEINIILEQ